MEVRTRAWKGGVADIYGNHTDDEAEKDPHAIHWTTLKRCTHRAMILSNGAVDTHRKESLHIGNTYPLKFLLCSIKKTTEITCNGFRPISNMSNISLVMGMFSFQN